MNHMEECPPPIVIHRWIAIQRGKKPDQPMSARELQQVGQYIRHCQRCTTIGLADLDLACGGLEPA